MSTGIVKKSFVTARAQIWHACADRYSHVKFFLTHPTPGVLGGYLLLKIFRDGPRPNVARMCG